MTMIRIGECRACGKTSRRDYQRRDGHTAYGGYYRSLADGHTVSAGEDLTCPRCGAFAWISGIVDGIRDDYAVCDHRCTGARGLSCQCSCAGDNHGRKFLVAEAVAEPQAAVMTAPARHWRSYGNDPLPNGKEALDQPLAAFPSWFMRITCDRCGKDRMLNEAHTARRDLRIRDLLAKMRHDGCGQGGWS